MHRLAGTWRSVVDHTRLSFETGGRFRLRPPHPAAETGGRFEAKGNLLTLRDDGSGPGPLGRYRWEIDGPMLHLTLIEDHCRERMDRFVQPWVRLG